MEDPSTRDGQQQRYRLAGWVYGLLGSAILALTVATPALASPERRSDIIHLLVGLPFFVLFALAIAQGHRAFAALARLLRVTPPRANAIGWWLREKLVMLLSVSAVARTLVFVGNGLGHRPRVLRDPVRMVLESVEPTPRMLVNALLMAIICACLVRASWLPFLERWRARRM